MECCKSGRTEGQLQKGYFAYLGAGIFPLNVPVLWAMVGAYSSARIL